MEEAAKILKLTKRNIHPNPILYVSIIKHSGQRDKLIVWKRPYWNNQYLPGGHAFAIKLKNTSKDFHFGKGVTNRSAELFRYQKTDERSNLLEPPCLRKDYNELLVVENSRYDGNKNPSESLTRRDMDPLWNKKDAKGRPIHKRLEIEGFLVHDLILELDIKNVEEIVFHYWMPYVIYSED